MNKKITSFFNKKRNFKKYFLLVIILMIVILLPEGQAHANAILDYIVDGLIHPVDRLISIIYMLLSAILNIGLLISTLWVMFGAWLVDVAMSPMLYVGQGPTPGPPLPGILNSATIQLGWTTVRDMCNMFFMFFFLLAAFGTIVGNKSFNVKSLLPKIVISMFLINFSKEITFLVIDVSQLFMYEIGSWMTDFGSGSGSLTNIVHSFNNEIDFLSLKNTFKVWTFNDVVQVAFALIYSLVLGAVYVMLAIFLFIRLVSFTILIILSPFAFLSIALPSMSKHATRWWSELLKWAIFGPAFMFFVYLSAMMANEFVGNANLYGPAAPSELGFLGAGLYRVVMASIPLLILMMAPQVASELGVKGSSQIVGGTGGVGKIFQNARGVGRKTWGFGKSAGRVAADRSETVRKTGDKLRDKKEWLNEKLPGGKSRIIANKAERERNKEDNMKKARVKFGREEDRELSVMLDIATGKLPATPEEKAATAETAIFGGKVLDNKTDLQEMMPAVESALSAKELKDNTHKDLNFALMTSKSQKRINNVDYEDTNKMDEDIKDQFTPSASNDKKKELVEEQIMRETVREMKEDGKDISKLNNLDDKRVSRVINDTLDSEDKRSLNNRLTKKKQKEFATGLAENGKTKEEIDELNNKANTGSDDEKIAAKKALKKDENLKIDAVNFGADLKDVFAKSGVDFEKHVAKSFSKFNPDVVAKLSDADLLKFGSEATSSQVHHLNRNGKEDRIKIIETAKEEKIKELYSSNNNLNESKQKLPKEEKKLKEMLESGEKEEAIKEQEQKISDLLKKTDELINLEKGVENIKSMIRGGKF
ncbi:hypothetical protein K0B03_03500 [Patescibacteria group bacterium]|nr:hypothetical protein [Patescibacteria group bacterium]